MAGRRGEVLGALRTAAVPLSIAEIAERLTIHPNTARFHLEALVRAGQVKSVRGDHARPGRPPLMFHAVPGMDPGGLRDYRMLARILADTLAHQSNPSARATAAGRAWATDLAGTARTPRKGQAVDRLTDLLADLGFSPEKRAGRGGLGEIGLRNCPFLELAQTHGGVVCPIHLGLMQGALDAWGAPITVDALTPFDEPDLCLAHLAPVEKAS